MTKNILETLQIGKFGIVEFSEHPSFSDSISGILLFENGYGLSIITKYQKRQASSSAVFGFSAHGSWERGTFEVAVGKCNNIDEFVFDVLPDLEEDYSDYARDQGVFSYVSVDFIESLAERISKIHTN